MTWLILPQFIISGLLLLAGSKQHQAQHEFQSQPYLLEVGTLTWRPEPGVEGNLPCSRLVEATFKYTSYRTP